MTEVVYSVVDTSCIPQDTGNDPGHNTWIYQINQIRWFDAFQQSFATVIPKVTFERST